MHNASVPEHLVLEILRSTFPNKGFIVANAKALAMFRRESSSEGALELNHSICGGGGDLLKKGVDMHRTAKKKRHSPLKKGPADCHPSYTVPMVVAAFRILELLRVHPKLTVYEIHERTGIAKSSVYRILRSLVAVGYDNRVRDGYYRYVFKYPAPKGV